MGPGDCLTRSSELAKHPLSMTMSDPPQEPSTGTNVATPQTRKKKPFVAQVLYLAFLSGTFWGLSQVLPIYGAEYIYPSIVLVLLALSLGGLGLRRHLRNLGFSQNEANWRSVPLILLAVTLCAYLTWQQYQASRASAALKPHLGVYLSTFSSPGARLPLTNQYFQFKQHDRINIPYLDGYVVVAPIGSTRTNVGLKLSLVNDSPVVIENIAVVANIHTNLAFKWGASWNEGATPSKPFAELQSAGARFTDPLFPGDSAELPEITFAPTTNSAPLPVVVILRARGMPWEAVAFLLVCPHLPGIAEEPHIARITRSPVEAHHFRVTLPNGK